MQRARAIVHYASDYYDPVKAHEYYLRNRHLKGRTTGGMSDQQKEAWAYTKDKITSEKKSKVDAERSNKDQKIEAFRSRADELRKTISEKLKQLNQEITKRAEAQRAQAEAELQAKIKSLPPIPKNISPEQRVILLEKRKQEIADIRSTTKADKNSISDKSQADRTGVSDSASAEREKVRTELKAAIASVRDEFNKARDSLNSGYEQTYQNEYDKILTELPGKEKSKRRRRR